jgi:hypothetical protein
MMSNIEIVANNCCILTRVTIFEKHFNNKCIMLHIHCYMATATASVAWLPPSHPHRLPT